MNIIQTHDYQFSERCSHLPSSFIRDILKVASTPDIISFAGGLPDPKLFPLQELQECAVRIFREDGRGILQYGKSEGLDSLKAWICEYYALHFGMSVSPSQLLVTNGSQQGLDLLAKAFINKGDKMVLEQPSYLGAIQAFMAYQPEIIPIDIRPDGIDIEALKNILVGYRPKLLYLVSNFQNPSGFTISEEKRKALASLASQHGCIIIDDDPYGLLRFQGDYLKPLRYYNRHAISCGSFSKIISPGLRLGWILADEQVIQKLLILKQASDLHSNNFSQMVIDCYLRNYSLERHLNNLKESYRKKCNAMYEAAIATFPEDCTIHLPEGGMFLWTEFPGHVDTEALLQRAMKRKVLFVPGKYFFTNGKGNYTMRLNFTNSRPETIEKGILILGEEINKMI